MALFRRHGDRVEYQEMGRALYGVSGGTLSLCTQMAVMASVPKSKEAVPLALLGLFDSVGGAVGQVL
ncbi:hypothetical protein AnigIFM63326_001588, partial [Aspergillus niger]